MLDFDGVAVWRCCIVLCDKLVFGVNAGIIREEQADASEGGRIAFDHNGLSTWAK